MATFLNHVAVATPRNATTTHTVTPSSGTVAAGTLFTPTAGNFLLCLAQGSVTSTTPTGWTLPTNGAAVNVTGLYVWYLASAAGSDSITTTHNGSNYPVVFDFYEFAAGSTFVKAAFATGVARAAGAGPSLTTLTGTNWIAGAYGAGVGASDSLASVTWNTGVEATDTSVAAATTDGYGYGLTYLVDSTLTTASAAATVTGGNPGAGVERLMFAVNVASGAVAATRFRRIGKRR